MRQSLPLLLLASGALARPNSPDVSGEVFYQIMPIAWRDSNNDANRYGDFGGLTASLDYLQYLGITSIYINPIFPSAAYHGYQHGDASQLNSWFGTEPQFLSFVAAAHARNMKVFLDYVAYGISQNSVWYASAHNNPASPYDTWLAFTNASNSTYTGSTYTTWSGATVGFINWNLADPNPVNLVTTWANHWLDPDSNPATNDGVDGFRLDHAYSSAPEGWGATISFWQTWATSLRATNPNVFIFCEPGDWGNYGTDLLTPTGFDAVITKPWEFAARSAISGETASGLYSSMDATIAAVPAGKTLVAEISDHDSNRIASDLGSSNPKCKVAAAVLLTQPFPPNIYYGDELGMRGTKNTSYTGDASDIPMREPFKWLAVTGPPMSNYFAANSAAYNGRVEQNNDGRSVQEQQGISGSLLEEYKRLIAARKSRTALKKGKYIPITTPSTRVWSFLRYDAASTQTVLVVINLYAQQVSTTLDLSAATIPGGTTTPSDLLGAAAPAAITDVNKAAYPITLPAYSYRILSVSLTPTNPGRADIDGANIPADFTAFGTLLATQTSPTALGDNISELDQLYARNEPAALALGITGNLATDGTALAILLDTQAGGQNPLSTSNAPNPPAGVALLNGTRLDAGFTPDTLIWVNTASGAVYVDQFALATAGGVTKTYRGRATVNSGQGVLTGGTNPNGMQAAMNNTNSAGVTASSAAGAATATTGFELLLPYADIGITTNCQPIKLAAFIARTDGTVTNQWLPPLDGRTTNPGIAPDLTTIPGTQFVPFTLKIPADASGDGQLNVLDFAAFLNLFAAQDPRANCDNSTTPPTLNPLDFACFLNSFAAGCN